MSLVEKLFTIVVAIQGLTFIGTIVLLVWAKESILKELIKRARVQRKPSSRKGPSTHARSGPVELKAT